jgi:hypothetical protein
MVSTTDDTIADNDSNQHLENKNDFNFILNSQSSNTSNENNSDFISSSPIEYSINNITLTDHHHNHSNKLLIKNEIKDSLDTSIASTSSASSISNENDKIITDLNETKVDNSCNSSGFDEQSRFDADFALVPTSSSLAKPSKQIPTIGQISLSSSGGNFSLSDCIDNIIIDDDDDENDDEEEDEMDSNQSVEFKQNEEKGKDDVVNKPSQSFSTSPSPSPSTSELNACDLVSLSSLTSSYSQFDFTISETAAAQQQNITSTTTITTNTSTTSTLNDKKIPTLTSFFFSNK